MKAVVRLNSPATVTEGGSYTVRVTVTNQSTRAGHFSEADLGIAISVTANGTDLIPTRKSSEYFLPNETRSFDYALNIPAGSGGQSGSIAAWIEDPTGRILADISESLIIESAAVVPEDFTATEEQCEEYQETATPEEYDAAIDDAYDVAAAEAEDTGGVVAWSAEEGYHVISEEEAIAYGP